VRLVCRQCKRVTDYVLPGDFCEYCGADDWILDVQKSAPKRHGLLDELKGYVGWMGFSLLGIFYLAVFLGGLWLLVFVVKWMWFHS
jgi:hypothetical protein